MSAAKGEQMKDQEQSVKEAKDSSGERSDSPRPALDAFGIAREELGMFGAMLSGSKRGYEESHPDHKAVFNANVISATHGKIWYGDVDLAREKDAKALQRIANRLGATVYLLREMDARFQYEDKPRISAAIATFEPESIYD